jgi:threonine dehydratase
VSITGETAMVGGDAIAAAVARVGPVIRPTPVDRSDSLSRMVGRPVLIKPEHLQRTGSFKIRGAVNFMAELPEAGEVVAGSAGNHAQGVALAARLSGRTARIFMPEQAPLPKLAATRDYGAEVVPVAGDVERCIAEAVASAERTGALFVPPFDHPAIIAGQGTIGYELVREAPEAEVVLVPVGGGGLLAGVAAALHAERPDIRVVGVQAEGAASMRRSMDLGEVSEVVPKTMADGVALRRPSALTFAHTTAYVDDVITVSEEQISRAVLVLLERAKAVVEPSGALAIAALLAGSVHGDGPAVALISGGNVDPLLLSRLIQHGLQAAHRFTVLRIVIDDRPGSLHHLTGEIAQLGVNVLSIEHHREGIDLPVAAVEVLVTLETRDADHQEEVIAHLTADGYTVTSVR